MVQLRDLKDVAEKARSRMNGVVTANQNNTDREYEYHYDDDDGNDNDYSSAIQASKNDSPSTKIMDSVDRFREKAKEKIKQTAKRLDQGENPTRVVSDILGTMFGSCTGVGSRCHRSSSKGRNWNANRGSHRRDGSGLSAKPESRMHERGSQRKSELKDESYYAQFYNDDHAKAAQAVLLARRQAEKEFEERILRQENGAQENHPLAQGHTENIRVMGSPYQLMEVEGPRGTISEASSVVSCNFDDGISALSAHTLEEMAKVEKKRLSSGTVPLEQGFDISADQVEKNATVPQHCSNLDAVTPKEIKRNRSDSSRMSQPPSPVETIGSNSSDGENNHHVDNDHSFSYGNQTLTGSPKELMEKLNQRYSNESVEKKKCIFNNNNILDRNNGSFRIDNKAFQQEEFEQRISMQRNNKTDKDIIDVARKLIAQNDSPHETIYSSSHASPSSTSTISLSKPIKKKRTKSRLSLFGKRKSKEYHQHNDESDSYDLSDEFDEAEI
mmetsp:Transcript_2491/g.3510  ORF Transcript_2491/g.3510 Transcript_2491/m.3510 type:complete len:499 (-) Transcript_2491:340-1836(-)|eukprot:CAMPEP_0184864832 /NCGR_PEP_ID=MMETSP0580-20130426/16112_1 /TAXON_ID=1118495 /ORGANISM="Dactyliosolen fragilissimus" /LENGTH=498 /DNA_ID=CAMNT_0027363753 /DNA_START=153 /DNA_END=1649 /DNA_ORIENTATION=-